MKTPLVIEFDEMYSTCSSECIFLKVLDFERTAECLLFGQLVRFCSLGQLPDRKRGYVQCDRCKDVVGRA